MIRNGKRHVGNERAENWKKKRVSFSNSLLLLWFLFYAYLLIQLDLIHLWNLPNTKVVASAILVFTTA